MILKVGLHGASGRMGQQISQIISSHPNQFRLEKVLGRDLVKQMGAQASLTSQPSQIAQRDDLDVVIDFSLPSALINVCNYCALKRVPLVSGTTGLDQSHFDALIALSRTTPVLWAPNMSLGIAVVAHMMKSLKAISSWDFQIEEIHHSKKIDSPSGTAKWLQNKLNKITLDPPTPLAIRGGGIFGTHKIWAMSESEVIRIEHEALNRAVFAEGALSAAKWLSAQKPGLYEIEHMLSDFIK